MKHSLKITSLLLGMFFIAQLIGIAVINQYSPETKTILTQNGTLVNVTTHNLPYGTEPPQDINPPTTLVSIIIALFIAIILMLLLMKFRAEIFLRAWFFIVITIAIAITINAFIYTQLKYSSLIALIIAIPFAILKVFKRNIIFHNFTELMIYPGIAAIFVPLLSIWTAVLLLFLISIYDIYAVWHKGFMQKMAKYQIKKVRVFAGFFVPYLGKKERHLIKKLKKSDKSRKIKVNIAILGGGDVVFPLILTGVVLRQFGFIPSLIIALGATIALFGLFLASQKGRFYPAMPFITAGCFLSLGIVYLLNLN